MRSLDALRCVGGYIRRAGSGVLGIVRRAVASLEFEDGWDVAGYICLSLGIALMLLGTIAAPDLPALYLLADDPQPIGDPVFTGSQFCPPNADNICDTGCKKQMMGQCSTKAGLCNGSNFDCVYCGCTERKDNSGFYCICTDK